MTQTPARIPPGRGKAKGDVDAIVETLRSELGRVQDERERKALDGLLNKAAASGNDQYKWQVANYVRRQHQVMFGPDQFLMPFLGILITMALPFTLIFFFSDSEPMGIRGPVFGTVLVAGMAGGIVRVLYYSVQKRHEATGKLQLFFIGLVHPLIGALLAVAVMSAFGSGLIAYPVPGPTAKVTVGAAIGAWTQAEMFVAFAGFVAGLFEERAIALLSRLAPKTLAEPEEKEMPAAPGNPPAPTQ